MGRFSIAAVLAVVALAVTVSPIAAQAPPPDVLPGVPVPLPSPPPPPPVPPPPPLWTGSIGFGFSVTSGNTDTSTINISMDLATRTDVPNVFKADVLYLRGDREGVLSVDRLSVKARNEYTRSPNVYYAFGQVEYLRDTFKDIAYLVAPSVGLGYKVHDTPQKALSFDVGLGLKIEKDMENAVTSGAATAAQRWRRQLSEHATVTQSVAALWTLDRFDDALYTIKLGLTADLTRRSQIKIEIVDLYKTRPPTTDVVRNDVSAVTAVVYKF